MNKYTWIFDAGHGGLDKDGLYTTDPKIGKRCDYPDGFTILEGVINRKVCKKVADKLSFLGVDVRMVHDESLDISLGERCQRTNAIKTELKKIFISFHSNAGKGKGFEVFTSVGQDASDVIAQIFCEEITRSFPDHPLRTDKVDGDADKEANFYVIMPSHNHAHARVLLENLFFDNRSEAEFMASDEGQQKLADYVVRAIVWIENNISL